MKFITTWVLLLVSCAIFAQKESKTQKQQHKQTQEFLSDANSEIFDDNFVDAEVNYRKAIATSPSLETGKYNLGNAYYNEAKNDEAMRRFAQAAEVAKNKPEKHKAYHNLGNTFMNAKKYQEAVESYKNALRNNPTDEETRYNLALAKEMLEKNPPQGGDGENDNQDQQDNQDQNENQDNKENDEGKDKEGDDGEQKEDESDQGDEKEKNQGEKEGDNEKQDQKDPKEQKDGQGDQPKEQKNQPVPGQLSPQQIKNLLKAMNDQEKKVQDKINAKKLKGTKVKSNKDW
ncbi:tetratricopeptide repeat protein [Aureisphaera galaxeae]|uniref:tetratricopeptide repeat protein n=1 Tax=Aureisphaera galaxeae TaxID=1538023 RepID=UPI00235016A5|nr:tetratricopeptide repeat protein [Aureisphaera galaxeae]MDC8005294.1 tetratricopeptide repeat protein [Aureisphaera galaxeae]